MSVTSVTAYPLSQPLDIDILAFSQVWVANRQVIVVAISNHEGREGCGEALRPAQAVARTIGTLYATNNWHGAIQRGSHLGQHLSALPPPFSERHPPRRRSV